jgi:uncharacterized protein (TIGR02145 family)
MTKTPLQFCAFLSIALVGCFSDNSPSATDPGTIDELQLKGSISGRVTDSAGTGISGVAATLDSGGFTSTTDDQGRYRIPDVPGRTWTVRFTKAGWADTSVSGVVLAIDEDRVGVDARMRRKPDTTIVVEVPDRRQVIGAIMGTDTIPLAAVRVVARAVSGDTLANQALSWDGRQQFGGLLPIVGQAGTLRIQGWTPDGNLACDTLAAFPADTGSLVLPVFRSWNNLPSVWLADAAGEPGALVPLHATARDQGVGKIREVTWSVGGSPFRSAGLDTSVVVPAEGASPIRVVVKVVDNTGAWALDTILLKVAAGLVDARDGQTYRTTTIGGQTWMAQNLNYQADSSWWYENSADSGAKYGRLYTWAAAMGLDDSCNVFDCSEQVAPIHQGACPSGWHVPTPGEWATLTTVAMTPDSAATRLRAASGWDVVFESYAGKDSYGFSALPGGLKNGESFDNAGLIAAFRTTARDTALYLQPYQASVLWTSGESGPLGYALRCLQDP